MRGRTRIGPGIADCPMVVTLSIPPTFFVFRKVKNTGDLRENIQTRRQWERNVKYGRIPGKTGGLTGMQL